MSMRLSIAKRSSSAARATPSHAPTGANVIGFATAVTVNEFSENNKVQGLSTPINTPRTQLRFLFRLRPPSAGRSAPLVQLKQIPRIDLVRHVRELVAPAVGDDHVAAGLEGLKVVGHLGAEELRCVQRGLADRHGHDVGLRALHDAMDRARAHDRFFFAAVDATTKYLHVQFNPLEQYSLFHFRHGTLANFDLPPKLAKLFCCFSPLLNFIAIK